MPTSTSAATRSGVSPPTTYGGTHAQTAMAILRGVWVLTLFPDILESNQPLQLPIRVNNRKLFDAMALKFHLRIFQSGYQPEP